MENEKLIMSYLAGVMDGDGSFSILKLTKGSLNPLYAPMLQCTTWRTEFLMLLKETFGGSLSIGREWICKDGSKGHALTAWKLRSGINCKPALEKLIPFLKIKRDRAQLILDFIEKSPFIRGKELTKEALILRESFYVKCIQMNDWKSTNESIITKLALENSEDPIVWAYIAGMMDTDGSFSVKKQVKNKGTDVKNPRYLPVISLSMTDTRAINFIRENCNVGKLYVPKNKDTRKGIHYQFGIYTKKEAIEFLRRIIPHLRAKKFNALTLLDFCVNSQNTGYCRNGIPDEELAFRESCYNKLCELNKYGVSKSSLMDLEFLPDNAEDNKGQAEKSCSLNVASGKTSLEEDAVL